jgi:adenine-specific DNA-methyltransferase
MPTLNWIGKDAVVKHHKEVPFRLLEPVPDLSCGDGASGNLIVQGGNVLTGPVFDVLPKFAGPKVIYAAASRMGVRAARLGLTFKQTPYALEV